MSDHLRVEPGLEVIDEPRPEPPALPTASIAKARRGRSRVTRLLVVAVGLAVVPLVVLRVDIAHARDRSHRLAEHDRQAAATLASARSALGRGRRDAADATASERHADGDLHAAQQLLHDAGLSQPALRPTLDSTGRYLRGLRALQSQAHQTADRLTRAVPVAKGCVSDGLQILSEASPGRTTADPAGGACNSLGNVTSDRAGSSDGPP